MQVRRQAASRAATHLLRRTLYTQSPPVRVCPRFRPPWLCVRCVHPPRNAIAQPVGVRAGAVLAPQHRRAQRAPTASLATAAFSHPVQHNPSDFVPVCPHTPKRASFKHNSASAYAGRHPCQATQSRPGSLSRVYACALAQEQRAPWLATANKSTATNTSAASVLAARSRVDLMNDEERD